MSTGQGKGAALRIGTSGWQYRHWGGGRFYPRDLPQRRWFEHYAREFDTVEVNNTFYHLPAVETFDQWREQTPEGFVYALKYSRYGSHIKRLKDPARHIEVFVERAERLGPCLGPVLVQLPPRWHADPQRLEAFLAAAPRTLRWSVELRDPDWLRPEVFAVLRRHEAALCIHDMLEAHPHELTAGWTYLRFHGPRGDYGGCYSPQALSAAAQRIRGWLETGHDVYAYFNNDAEAYAVANAQALRRYLRGD